MALKLFNMQNIFEKQLIRRTLLLTITRGRLRGKPPGIARSLEKRLEDEKALNYDPVLEEKVDIGFPPLNTGKNQKERRSYVKSQNQSSDLEKLSRMQKLLVNLDEVKADWLLSNGQYQIKNVATHYGVFEHLFGKYAYFLPRVPMTIHYEIDEENLLPVHYGNLIKPSDAEKQPLVTFDSNIKLIANEEEKKDSLWTLLLTNPDGHFTDSEKEYAHWFVSNIPNGDVSKGECIVPYLQPFPMKGTGYHRHIFVLYKQEKRLDFSSYKVNKISDLESRTFTTFDFYKKYQDVITPAGLSFFQSTWDKSLTDFYHKVLDIKEPRYEYDFPKPYIREEQKFPLRQPFNVYLDKYRDPKEIAKEFIDRKLGDTHPFNGRKPAKRYPNAHPVKGIPSWLKTAKVKSRLGQGRILDYEEIKD